MSLRAAIIVIGLQVRSRACEVRVWRSEWDLAQLTAALMAKVKGMLVPDICDSSACVLSPNAVAQ